MKSDSPGSITVYSWEIDSPGEYYCIFQRDWRGEDFLLYECTYRRLTSRGVITVHILQGDCLAGGLLLYVYSREIDSPGGYYCTYTPGDWLAGGLLLYVYSREIDSPRYYAWWKLTRQDISVQYTPGRFQVNFLSMNSHGVYTVLRRGDGLAKVFSKCWYNFATWFTKNALHSRTWVCAA